MTKPTTLPAGKLLILMGDGASPEVFTAPCGLTSKGFNQTANTQESAVPDCDDPDAPAYVERGVDTLSSEISGSGILAVEALPKWRGAFGVSKNYRIKLDHDDAGYFQGPFILTGFNITSQRGQKVNTDLTLQSDGEWEWVDA